MNNISNVITKDKELCIYALQEPHYNAKSGKVTSIPRGYKIFGEKGSRAIIVAPPNAPIFYSHELSTKDCTVCLFESGNICMYIISLYLDILKECVSNELTLMLEKIQTKNVQTLICSDTNSHSVLFGDASSNKRGEELELLVAQFNLNVLNVGNKCTFNGPMGSSIIDASFLLGNTNIVKKWELLDSYWFSPHSCIEIKMNLKVVNKPALIKHTDWVRFKNALPKQQHFYRIWTHEVIEKESDLIQQIICNAIDSSMYLKPKKAQSAKFWDKELELQKMKVRKLFSIWKNNKNAENRENFVSAQHAFRKEVRKKRRVSWKNFVGSIQSPKNMASLTKILKGRAHENIGLLKKPDGSFCQNSRDTLELLMSTHFPQSETLTAAAEEGLSIIDNDKFCYEEDLDDSFITLSGVKKAISSFGPDKAPGIDQLRPRSLQALTDPILKRICRLYQAMLKLSYTPRKWRECNVIFLAKPGRDSYDQSKSFRPLSMSSFMLKTFEKLVLWQILATALKESPINKNSHAFRSGYSVDTCISDLTDQIEKNVLSGGHLLLLNLDIMGCFDNIPNKSAINALKAKKVCQPIVSWYSHFIYNRSATTEINGAKGAIKINKGQPQGSVLAPLVASIIFEDFLHLFEDGPITSRNYADDFSLAIGGPCTTTLANIMQTQGIKKAEKWAKKHQLSFAPQKSVAMLFTHRRKIVEPPKLKICNTTIEYQKKLKYLGIVFDERLSFSFEWEQRIMRAKKLVMQVRNAMGSIWGASPKALKWAYEGIVVPMLSYGSCVTARACKQTHIKNKLNRLNRLMALTLCPLRKNSPSEALEVILGLCPLDLKIEEMSLRSHLRILSHRRTTWSGFGRNTFGTIKWAKEKLLDIGINEIDFDNTKELNINSNYEVVLESFKSGTPNSTSDVNIFTDGSKLNDNCGYGFCINQGNVLIAEGNGKASEKNTVFQCEVLGITKGCDELLNMDAEYNSITIFSDSQAAISALAALRIESHAVKNCVDKLNTLGQNADVQIKYVRAHIGHFWNEKADKNARLGSTNDNNKVHIATPTSWAKKKITDSTYKRWSSRWSLSKIGRQTKLWWPKPDKQKSKLFLNQTRTELGHQIQMITGFNRLNYHESKISGVDPTCRLCLEEEETSYHIISECPALWSLRQNSFNTFFLEEPSKWKPHQLQKFLQSPIIMELNSGEALNQS